MKEGSLDAPTRHPLDWRSEAFYDRAALDAEMRRQFDICHGCRRCFNLCDSFPRLFDLIDDSQSGELDSVSSDDFAPVVDACTICDMCFMTKCPYVPPHAFNLDFPHLMLRYRAAALQEKGKPPFVQSQLAQMDRNGTALAPIAPLANWGSKTGNAITRPALEAIAGIDKTAELPKFAGKTFVKRAHEAAASEAYAANAAGLAQAREAVIFATCAVNYNNPRIGEAAAKVLAHLGVDVTADYPGCCGMPYLEQGDIAKVAAQAEKIAAALRPAVDAGKDIITLIASCSLMFKFEWPLIVPDNEDVKALAAATRDICEYVVDIANTEGLPDGLADGLGDELADGSDGAPQSIAMHLACHARAQNIGPKSAELLRLIPHAQVRVIERCSGHGGTFGVMKQTRPLAVKVGRPAARAAAKAEPDLICSDCPLAAKHLAQLVDDMGDAPPVPAHHPIEVFAAAYKL